ncbi:DUF4328 domain-containing protein [Streptomyces sp. NPDC048430]|uniref:DUF4328 domain-containing protein n=1 Tax=unclassified Streptomyces TaxID=2593676 RepID=UPI003439F13C
MAATPAPPAEAGHRLRSPVGLARAAVVLLGIVIATDLLAVAAGLNLRGEYAVVTDGFVFDGDGSYRAAQWYAGVGVLQSNAMMATAVLFILWFRRVRLNAEVFDAGLQSMRPGWAVGAWFIPVANFWLPRRVAGGIWTASAQTNPDGAWRTVSMAPLNLWWGVWVFSMVFSQYAGRQYEQTRLSPEIVDAVGLVLVGDVLDIAAAVLAILFVRKLTRMQGERAALGVTPLSAPSPAGPAPA